MLKYLVLSSVLLVSAAVANIDINTTSCFPHDIRKPFYINFKTNPDSDSQTVFLLIRNCKDLEMERYQISLTMLDDVNGSVNDSDSFNRSSTQPLIIISPSSNASSFIDSMILDRSKKTAELKIKFLTAAYRQTLEVFSGQLQPLRRHSWTLDNRLYRRIIDLTVTPRIHIRLHRFFKISDNSSTPLQFMRAQCVAEGGMPAVIPSFQLTQAWNLQEPGEIYSSNTTSNVQYATAVLELTRTDDRRVLHCRVGLEHDQAIIRVHHHATDLNISPSPSNQIFLTNGDSLECQNVNGYPQPQISWQLLYGPHNSRNFVNLSSTVQIETATSELTTNHTNVSLSQNVLTLVNNPPEWSLWQLHCKVKSNVNGINRFLNKSITFIVQENKTNLTNIDKDSYKMVSYLQKRLIKLEIKSELEKRTWESKLIKLSQKQDSFERAVIKKLRDLPRCTSGFKKYENYCYLLSEEFAPNYNAAQLTCEIKGGNLLWLANGAERDFIFNDLNPHGARVLIGWKNGKWTHGNSNFQLGYVIEYEEKVNYNMYYNGRLVNRVKQNCRSFNRNNLEAVNCDSRNRYICKSAAMYET